MAKAMICKKCGRIYPEDARFCGICGVTLEPAENTVEEHAQEDNAIPRSEMHVTRSIAMAEEPTGALICTGGPQIGSMVELESEKKVLIGRDSARCAFVLQDSKASRQHFEITFSGATGRYLVTDMSTNGTYLSDGSRMIKGKGVYLSPGEELKIAEGLYTFRLR